MSFPARFASRCPSCEEWIRVGDEIQKAGDQPATHADCEEAADPVEIRAPARPEQTRAATAAERQTGAEQTLERRLALLEGQVAAEIRARAAIARALVALGHVAAELLNAGDERLVALSEALDGLQQVTSTNPLDRAAARAAVDPAVGF